MEELMKKSRRKSVEEYDLINEEEELVGSKGDYGLLDHSG